MKKKLRGNAHREHLQALQELKILEEDVLAARNFIREQQTYTKKRGKLWGSDCKIPLYLILGPPRFGKTTLLAQAGLDLVDVCHEPLQSVHPTKYCSYWFTPSAVYIDTAGTYTKPDITKPRNDLIWQGFIKLLQKHFGKGALAGVLVVLDLPAIAENQDLLKRTLFCVRERIYEITHLVRQVHLHMVFTKCDRILGFSEFFSFFSAKERTQPFGIVFPKGKQGNLVQDFIKQFSQLLQHLNDRVVENLNQTTHHTKRALIKSFPLQLDYLRPILLEVISNIPHSSNISLSGIYFTSSIQDGAPINPLKAVFLRILNLKEKLGYALESQGDCSYFVKELFTHIIKTRSNPMIGKKSKRNWGQYLHLVVGHLHIVFGVFVALGVGAVVSYKSYHHNVDIINRTNIALQSHPDNDAQTLYKLSGEVHKHTTSLWVKFGLNKIHDLYEKLLVVHSSVFTRELITQLESFINAQLDNPKPSSSAKLYHGLMVYLMLGNPQKRDANYVMNWFSNCWAETYGNGEKKVELLHQLSTVLQRGLKIEPNRYLVNAVRTSLNDLPPAEQAYLILESSYPYWHLDIGRNKSLSVSSMYVKENFAKIYDDVIPHINERLPKQDWVWGVGITGLHDRLNSDLIAELREHYLKQYVSAWQNIFAVASHIELEDLASATQYFQEIAAPNSSLENILKQIQLQTNIVPAPATFKQQLEDKLGGLRSINFVELRNHLQEVDHFFLRLTQNFDSNAASFDLVTKYLKHGAGADALVKFRTFAQQQPLFLQNYLMTLANDAWQVTADGAYRHISHVWNNLIMPKYRSTLGHKYPLFKDSKEDIKLEDFTRFFGPHELIDNFFSRYIEPLVIIDKTNWQWKSINDAPLGFSPVFLEVFLRAALIQKMFYANKSAKPYLEFTLAPISMTPNTQSFTLHLDGQKITASALEQQAQALVWPGPHPGVVTMDFVDMNGKYSTVTELGPWAWFKLLDKAGIIARRGTKQFYVTFDLNGNSVKYTLTSNEAVNPFIPDIISNFRCQEQ